MAVPGWFISYKYDTSLTPVLFAYKSRAPWIHPQWISLPSSNEPGAFSASATSFCLENDFCSSLSWPYISLRSQSNVTLISLITSLHVNCSCLMLLQSTPSISNSAHTCASVYCHLSSHRLHAPHVHFLWCSLLATMS